MECVRCVLETGVPVDITMPVRLYTKLTLRLWVYMYNDVIVVRFKPYNKYLIEIAWHGYMIICTFIDPFLLLSTYTSIKNILYYARMGGAH